MTDDCDIGGDASTLVSQPELLMSDHAKRALVDGELLRVVTRLGALPGVIAPVVVYPDASLKSFGFPNGISLHTTGDWIYPLAAPDMGCGFETIDTGIDLPGGSVAHLRSILNDLRSEIGTASPSRVRVRVGDLQTYLARGLAGVSPPRNFHRATPSEEANSWEPASIPLLGNHANVADAVGAATGHFVALHIVQESDDVDSLPPGRVVLVVHTGSAPIRDVLNNRGYYLELAQWSVSHGYSEPSAAARGMFGVPVDTLQGREFLSLAMACRNFGYANREVVADRVLEILLRYWRRSQTSDAREIRHVDHVAIERFGDETLRARRGLQPVSATRRTFIAGGAFSHAYLCNTAASIGGGLCPHGAPVLPEYRLAKYVSDTTGWGARNRGFGAGDRLLSNVNFDEQSFLADVFNLEEMLSYTEAAHWVMRSALVSPLLNYQDARG